MARYSAAWRTTGAGSTTLPIAGLMSGATGRLRLVECGVFNTTSTACVVVLRRVTAAGTSGATQTVVYESDPTQAALATPKDTWTVAPTFATGNIRPYNLGAAVGSGVLYTFGGPQGGLMVPDGTANGVVLVPLTGTGQICDVYFSWDE